MTIRIGQWATFIKIAFKIKWYWLLFDLNVNNIM